MNCTTWCEIPAPLLERERWREAPGGSPIQKFPFIQLPPSRDPLRDPAALLSWEGSLFILTEDAAGAALGEVNPCLVREQNSR